MTPREAFDLGQEFSQFEVAVGELETALLTACRSPKGLPAMSPTAGYCSGVAEVEHRIHSLRDATEMVTKLLCVEPGS